MLIFRLCGILSDIFAKRAFLAIAAFLVVAIISDPANARREYYWQQANRHSFCKNFEAGREADGRPLFISQISRQGIRFGLNITFDDNGNVHGPSPIIGTEPGSWHLGKAGEHLKDGATYPYGGKEYDVGSFHTFQGNKYKHLVFCLRDTSSSARNRLKWVNRKNGQSHPKAVHGFNSDENQMVCRANWGGGIHPGKLIPSSKSCYIGYGGGEKSVREYQVLIYEN